MRVSLDSRDAPRQVGAAVDQPYIESVEPEDESPPALIPEQQLVLAVLHRALADLRRHNPDHVNEARAFVASEACAELCEWLGYSGCAPAAVCRTPWHLAVTAPHLLRDTQRALRDAIIPV